jgi:hypothetical protein
MLVIKYDSGGNELWGIIEGGNSEEYVRKMDLDAEGDVYLNGLFLSPSVTFGGTTLSHTTAGQSELYIAKLSASQVVGIDELSNGSFTLSPNPMTSETAVVSQGSTIASVRILDASGKVIREVQGNSSQVVIERGGMTPGAYFVQLTDADGGVSVQKLLVE